jgi:hypothetical protein
MRTKRTSFLMCNGSWNNVLQMRRRQVNIVQCSVLGLQSRNKMMFGASLCCEAARQIATLEVRRHFQVSDPIWSYRKGKTWALMTDVWGVSIPYPSRAAEMEFTRPHAKWAQKPAGEVARSTGGICSVRRFKLQRDILYDSAGYRKTDLHN